MLVGPEDWQTENLLPVTEKYIALWQGFPNSGKGVGVGVGNLKFYWVGGGGGVFYWMKGTWWEVILMIRTFFKAKNSFRWMLNINLNQN